MKQEILSFDARISLKQEQLNQLQDLRNAVLKTGFAPIDRKAREDTHTLAWAVLDTALREAGALK